jgi:hypothetical protein
MHTVELLSFVICELQSASHLWPDPPRGFAPRAFAASCANFSRGLCVLAVTLHAVPRGFVSQPAATRATKALRHAAVAAETRYKP